MNEKIDRELGPLVDLCPNCSKRYVLVILYGAGDLTIRWRCLACGWFRWVSAA